MSDNEIPIRELEITNEIKSILNERKDQYGSFLVKTVIAKDKNLWLNVITRIEPLHKESITESDIVYDYNNVIIAKIILNFDEIINLLKNLWSGEVNIKGLPSISFKGTWRHQQPIFYPSGDEIFKLEWPSNYFHLKSDINIYQGSIPQRELVAVGNPFFPDRNALIENWIGIDISRHDLWHSILFILPNYKAKIDEIRLGSKQLTISIITREIKTNEVIGLLYIKKEGMDAINQEFNFSEGNSVKLSINFSPDFLYIYIISKESERLDFRRVYLSWPSLPKGFIIDFIPTDIEELIKRGENEHVEFKVKMDEINKEFLETVVAFSNNEGGMILIGVDNDRNIIGSHEKNIEQRLTNRISNTCEPVIIPIFKTIKLEGKNIDIVEIKEGDDKPYNVIKRGVFVRRGSQDYIASRIELNAFYETSEGSIKRL